MRKLIQFVLILALLLGGDVLSAVAMPCCAPTHTAGMQADMQMPPAASPAASCHATVAVTENRMSLQAAALLRCPRAAANLQAGDEWKNSEQAEFHSPLQVARNESADRRVFSPEASCVSLLSQASVPNVSDPSKSLPLRI